LVNFLKIGCCNPTWILKNLKNYPIGKYRKSAIIENAHHVFYHSLQLVSETLFFENHESESQSGITSEVEIEEHVFHQKV